MKIFIDIGHPAHVHLFKNFVKEMENRQHKIFVSARDKECSLNLLNYYKIKYVNRGTGSVALIGKGINLIKIDLFLYKLARKFKPDILIGVNNPYIAHIAWLLRKPSYIFNDTEHARLSNIITYPFATKIITPSCYKENLEKKQIRYHGYHELAYLHPNYFKPDPHVLKKLGLKKGETFIILRFIAWQASHDIGHKGITLENKINAVKEFTKYAKVFISSEGKLPDFLEEFRIKIQPEKMHDALYYATLLYGESATMASECAALGTPAIFLDNEGRGYTDEEEAKYNLVFNFTESLADQELSIKKAIELLQRPNIKEEWQKRRQRMLSEKIDVTAFMVWLIENYPESVKIMKNNPDYQFNFK